jgi:hypothetical protein
MTSVISSMSRVGTRWISGHVHRAPERRVNALPVPVIQPRQHAQGATVHVRAASNQAEDDGHVDETVRLKVGSVGRWVAAQGVNI